MKTKKRILFKVIELFNGSGYYTPTLADLAKACNMSRGNFAYHFKYKEDLLDEIAGQMSLDIDEMQSRRKGYPAFSNLSLDIRTFGMLQKRYLFIFRDMSILSFASIRKVMSEWSEKTIRQNMDSFAFAIEVGTMKPEPFQGLYYNLAVNTWLIMYYWVAQQNVRVMSETESAEKMVWSTIIPHFTSKGLNLFTSYYGESFLKELGAPFEVFVDQKQLF